MWLEPTVLSRSYCREKRGIVGEKNMMNLQGTGKSLL